MSTLETSIENTAKAAVTALNALIDGASFTTIHKADIVDVGGARWIAYIIYT